MKLCLPIQQQGKQRYNKSVYGLGLHLCYTECGNTADTLGIVENGFSKEKSLEEFSGIEF